MQTFYRSICITHDQTNSQSDNPDTRPNHQDDPERPSGRPTKRSSRSLSAHAHAQADLASTPATYEIKSQTRREYPISLSYQAINLTNLSLRAIPALASKTEDEVDPTKSVELQSHNVQHIDQRS